MLINICHFASWNNGDKEWNQSAHSIFRCTLWSHKSFFWCWNSFITDDKHKRIVCVWNVRVRLCVRVCSKLSSSATATIFYLLCRVHFGTIVFGGSSKFRPAVTFNHLLRSKVNKSVRLLFCVGQRFFFFFSFFLFRVDTTTGNKTPKTPCVVLRTGKRWRRHEWSVRERVRVRVCVHSIALLWRTRNHQTNKQILNLSFALDDVYF